MKIKFDSNQQYQRNAMDVVLGLFDGQPLSGGAFGFVLSDVGLLAGLTELGVGNRFALDEAALLRNLQTVQNANKLPASDALGGMNFSAEMETGTGKTYVYLRSIFERYGFSKFIILAPSVAIREGVIASLRLTREHFQALFGNVAFDSWVYDSKQYSKLRQRGRASSCLSSCPGGSRSTRPSAPITRTGRRFNAARRLRYAGRGFCTHR